MELIIVFFIGIITSTIGGLLGWLFVPTLKNFLENVFCSIYLKFSPSAVYLTDTWITMFEEPEPDGTIIESTEEVKIIQRGKNIKGQSKIRGKYPREFIYDGEIYHDLFWGKYRHKDSQKGSTAGKGIFLLEITKDRQEMNGFCAWLDKDTKKIETSDYVWKRK